MASLRTLLALVLSTSLAMACASLPLVSRRAEDASALPAPIDLHPDLRLSLEILIFDPGLPEEGKELPDDISPGIREAEAHYLACLLKNTLAKTAQWGDVYLGPRESGAVEAYLYAEIVRSDGDELVLEVDARDATRREWLSRRYRMNTTFEDYSSDEDPYQRMFNTIANDLVEARNRLTLEELYDILRVAELQFAADFVPASFDGYLEEGRGGRLEVVRLPAEDDPMVSRVLQARDREAMFIDSLNGHYEGLCAAMTDSYLQWRGASRSEVELYKDARKSRIMMLIAIPIAIAATIAGAVAAGDSGGNAVAVLGTMATHQIYKKAQEFGSEAELHKGTLEEMNASFDAEVKPIVVQTADETHRLTGTVDEQYAEWRRLLAELYEAETGVLTDMSAHIDRSAPVSEDALPEVTPPPPAE